MKQELSIEPILPDAKIIEGELVEPPSYMDPEWTDYVISQLDESEFWEGIPKLDGLRRLVEKLISPIVRVNVDIKPVIGNSVAIIATATVLLRNGDEFSAASDATPSSSPEGFRNRLTALADSRAKSKVYREILRLRNISTTEEVNQSIDTDEHEPIVGSQTILINNLIKDISNTHKKRIFIGKLIKELFPSQNGDINVLKYSEAGKIIQKLSDFKAKRQDIPDSVLE
ncbi:MAG: hypothetical protein ACK6DA_09760 [Candidatus Kapaibacterium sp.]|jgi:hypothetical protein